MVHSVEYSLGRYRIRINIWYLIIFLLAQTVLNELGYWQLQRAKEKQLRLEQVEIGGSSSVTELEALTPEQIQQFQSVTLNLSLASNKIVLLDNKIKQKKPGYHVYQLAYSASSDRYVLVNRGWIYAGEARENLPKITLPPQDWQVSARIYPLAQESLSTKQAKIEYFPGYMRLPVLDHRILTSLDEYFGVKIEPYILRIDRDDEMALEVNWMWTNMPVEKHLAYAVQWFALALALLVISLIAAIKR